MVEADAGAIGGDVNHEFVVFADAGESEIFACECGYTANSERAESLGSKADKGEEALPQPQLVETPGQKTVEEVSGFLGVTPAHLVKTLLFKSREHVVAALVPGDRTLNETKLMKLLDDPFIEPLDEEEIKNLTGSDVGFSGPVGLPVGTRIIADPLLERV